MGKLSITKNLIIIFFFISACTIIHSFSFAESIIMINSQSSELGKKVTFTVSVRPGTGDSTEIEAFGFRIQYNDKVLKYINYSADSIKDLALFPPPMINKRSKGLLQAGGSFMNPEKIDKTIDLFQIDFECLECTEGETSLNILEKVDGLENFTSINGTFNCLGTGEDQTDKEKTDATIQEDPDEIIELTNKTISNDQPKPYNDQPKPYNDQPKPYNDQPKPDNYYSYTRFPPDTPASDQGTVGDTTDQGTGGGAAGGQTQESSGISDLSIAFRSLPSVQNTFPKDGAEDIKTDISIRLTFNQSMSQITVEDAFVIEPYLDGQFKWNENFTEVEFIPETQLEPGMLYSVKLTDQVADKYGQYIDGDFDGKIGGKFSFSFQTTENGKDISDEKPVAISPNVTRCFIISILSNNFLFERLELD